MKTIIRVACLKSVPCLGPNSLFCINVPVVSAEVVMLELGAAVVPVLPVVEITGAEVPVEPEKTGENFLI